MLTESALGARTGRPDWLRVGALATCVRPGGAVLGAGTGCCGWAAVSAGGSGPMGAVRSVTVGAGAAGAGMPGAAAIWLPGTPEELGGAAGAAGTAGAAGLSGRSPGAAGDGKPGGCGANGIGIARRRSGTSPPGRTEATRPAVATWGPALKEVEETTKSAAAAPSGREPSGRVVSGSSGLTPGPLGDRAATSTEGRGEPLQSGQRSTEPTPSPTSPAPANSVPTAARAAAAPAAAATLLFALSLKVPPSSRAC